VTDTTLAALSDALQLVGFHQNVEASLREGLSARRWSSSYAHVYVVDVLEGAVDKWPELLAEVDRQVLNQLRADELTSGGVMDAHVCFLIDDLSRRQIEARVDERSARNVSRKYWIGRAEGFEGFQARLSLLSMGSVSALAPRASFGISADDQKWVDVLVEEGPDVVFRRLLAESGCTG
jgi:hypothetical protein